jgi:hypothetical protein
VLDAFTEDGLKETTNLTPPEFSAQRGVKQVS